MAKKDYSVLLQKLRSLRIQFGYTQLFIANYLCISKEAYRKIEGGRTPLSMERFLLICDLFNVHPADVLDDCIIAKRQSELLLDINRLNSGQEELKEDRAKLWNLLQQMIPPSMDWC